MQDSGPQGLKFDTPVYKPTYFRFVNISLGGQAHWFISDYRNNTNQKHKDR